MTAESNILPGRCWWVIKDTFLAGGYPYNPGIDNSEEFLGTLISIGIDAFIDLTEEDELTHYQKNLTNITKQPLIYNRFPIVDYSVPTISEMNVIISHIKQLLENGHRLYLHCRGGIGRTGTVVGCWLKSQGKESQEAISELKILFSASNASRFTSSPQTDEQKDFVVNYVATRE